MRRLLRQLLEFHERKRHWTTREELASEPAAHPAAAGPMEPAVKPLLNSRQPPPEPLSVLFIVLVC